MISPPPVCTLYQSPVAADSASPGAFDTGFLFTTDSEMRSTHTLCGSFGPASDPVASARMRVRYSYLMSRWVQAPITDWREADT